jgi:hypothetical protein
LYYAQHDERAVRIFSLNIAEILKTNIKKL